VFCVVATVLTPAASWAGSPPSTASVGATPFYNGPYLQHLSSTRVEVKVELDMPAAATLEVQEGEGKKRSVAHPVATFHSFVIDGLSPSTSYRYVVRAGAFESPVGVFVTAPADDGRAPFSFIVYGDTRSNDQAHAAVVRAIREQPADFLVNTGDFVPAGSDLAAWHGFFAIEADLLRDRCVFACIGNHELVEDEAATHFVTYFGARDPGDAGHVDLYGSFRWGSGRFLMLNAFQDWGRGELDWLSRELEKADGEAGLSLRVVVVHRSPWSSGHHGDDARALAAGVPELLVRHHVDLVFAGHDHMYERGEWKGLKYVITGGGGAPLYPDITAKSSTRRVEAAYNFVRVSVDGDAVKLVALRPDGSTLESCGFRRGENWDCDAAAAPDGAASAQPVVTEPPHRAERGSSESADSAGAHASRCGCRVPGERSALRTDGALGFGSLAFAWWFGRLRRARARAPLRAAAESAPPSHNGHGPASE
jgi:hypothetical protein